MPHLARYTFYQMGSVLGRQILWKVALQASGRAKLSLTDEEYDAANRPVYPGAGSAG